MRKTVVTLTFLAALMGGGAHAAVLLVDSSGVLIGATGVDVGGAYYNVEFKDGSCLSLFGGCTDSAFTFQSNTLAKSATNALTGQVLTDSAAGNFDSLPALTLGCASAPSTCYTLTPYGTAVKGHSPMVAQVYAAQNPVGSANVTATKFTFAPDSDTSTLAEYTYAMWSPVPLPDSFGLLAVGILGWMITRHTLRSSARRIAARRNKQAHRAATRPESHVSVHTHRVAFGGRIH